MQTIEHSPARDVPASLPRGSRARTTLNALSLLGSEALEVLFASASPLALEALDGHPRGRVLAIPGWDEGFVAQGLRTLHASAYWPWQGKSFSSVAGASEGRGTNRVLYPTRRGLFPFRTYAANSVVDRRPCFVIDYDVAPNPARVRTIYDEVRQVDDGLYLGRGMRRRPGREPKLVLWFGLDARVQDAAI